MNTRRVLIAEDSRVLQVFYAKLLTPCFPQYYFRIVTNGVEAYSAYREAQYDMVITDLDMPDLAGDELHRLVSKLSAEESRAMPAFIFCSGAEDELDSVRATCSGKLNHFMLKPFRWHELQDLIFEIFEGKVLAS